MAQDLNRSIKIYIDNSDAMQKSEKLEKKISSLRAELQKLDAEGKKESKQYTTSEKALAKMERTRGAHLNKVKETQRVLRDLSGSTYKELQQVQRALRADLQKSTRGTEEYNQKLKLYQSLQRQITAAQREMNGQLGSQSSLWSRMTAGFNKYFGIVSTFAASITGLSLAFRKLSQDAAAMEDVYDGVSKTTGFTRDQVQKLNEEFKKMDTRVPREELNKFAADAGKLGKETEEDILGFVNAAVRIRVGIGKDLGDDALIDIAKMTDIFVHSTKEMESMNLEERMIATGSAIRYLAKQSTAAEPPIVNFASRMTGIASQAKISMQDVLGFGSALDQLKQPTEMAATALQKFIMKMFTDTSKYAQIAGMDVAKFSTLLQTDANTAIKTVLRALNDKGGFSELAPIFQEMGLDGARAVGVLSALAANINMVDEAQRDANKSFAEATTLDEEYNIMNKNAQASLEKRRQAFKDAAEELGQRLNPALLKSTNMLTYIVKFLPDLLDFLFKYGKYIGYLVSAYAVYTVSLKLNAVWQNISMGLSVKQLALHIKETTALKAKAMAVNLNRSAGLAYAAVQALLTGNITRMNRAWKLLTASMATNPFGLLMVAVSGAVYGISKLVKHLNNTNKATKTLKETSKQFADELVSESREANELFQAFKRTNAETDTHQQLKKEIMSRYGKYLQHLVDEEGNITDIGAAITAVNVGIREQIALKIRNAAADELGKQALDKQLKATDKVMERISKQVPSDVVRSSIRTTINRTLTEFESSEIKDYAALQQDLLAEIQQSFGVDAYKGVFNIKNAVADLVDEFKRGDTAMDDLNSRFDGLIAKQVDVNSLLSGAGVDNKKGGGGGGDTDKDIYKAKLEALNLYLAQRREALMRDYLAGNITHEQYLFQLEQLERESLDRQYDIYELDVVKQQEITNKILEYKLKAQQMLEESEHKHLLKLQELNEAADRARAEQNWKSLKQIAAQNEQHWNEERTRRNEQMAAMAGLAMDFADEMGTLIGGAMSGNEDMVQSSLKSIINMALDALKLQVQMAVAGATALSLAQPDSVATFGASGFARAAVLVGLIEAAFSAVKGVVSSALGGIGSSSSSSSSGSTTTTTSRRVVDQRAAGKYDVLGAQDGRRYSVPYLGPASTGVVPSPALVGEYGPELIVSAPDFSRLQRHVNYPLVLRAIQDSRVPQRAEGNYSALPPAPSADGAAVQMDSAVMAELLRLLRTLNQQGVHASVNIHEISRAQRRLSDAKSGGARR